jgi:hypothetical protein
LQRYLWEKILVNSTGRKQKPNHHLKHLENLWRASSRYGDTIKLKDNDAQ